MTDERTESTIAWPLALAAAAIAGTLATACMMPLVAVATLAAATMKRTPALIALLGAWAVNQLIGFCALGYPATGYAFAWGGALAVAGVAALFVARHVLGRVGNAVAGLAAAFAAAFVAYELLLLGFAGVAGGLATFTPAIVLRILANDAAWLIVLALFHALLGRAAPRLFGRAPALRHG